MSTLRLVAPAQVVLYDGPIPAAEDVVVPDVLLGPYEVGTDLVFELTHDGYVDRSDRPANFYVSQTDATTAGQGAPATVTLEWRDLNQDTVITLLLHFGFEVTVTDKVIVTSSMSSRPKGRQTHFY